MGRKLPRPQHEETSKVCQSPHRKTIEKWLKNKNKTDLGYRRLSTKVKKELGENISRTALWRHHKWMKKQQNLALTE